MAFLEEGLLAFNLFLLIFYLIGGIIHMGILLYLIHKGRNDVSEGLFKNFITSVLVSYAASLVFFIWSLLSKLGVLKIENPLQDIVLTTLVSLGFLLGLTYLSFTIRDLTLRFGFRSLGQQISFQAQKALKEKKKSKKK